MASNSVFAELLRSYKLDGSNYTIWKRKITFLLTAENIDYITMTPEPNEPSVDASEEERDNYEEEMKEWTTDNKKARVYILGSMSDSLATEYESEKASYRIMTRLEEDFGEVSLIKVLSLFNKFLTVKMTDSVSVNEHLNKLSVLNEELRIAGYPFPEQVLVMVALNSLPHSWEQFKISFCHSERNLNMRSLRHHLLMEEDRKSSQGKERHSHQNELHLGEDRRNWNKRNSTGDLRNKINRKRDWDNNDRRGSNQNFGKKYFKCHNCGDYGHFRNDCKKRRKPSKPYEKHKRPNQDKHDDKHRDKYQDKRQDNKKENSSPDAAGLY